MAIPGSAEREHKSFRSGIEKFDLELPVGNGLWLSNELIESLFDNYAVTLRINIASVSSERRLLIDEHAEAHRCSLARRSHDQVKITSMKAIGDAPIHLVEDSTLFMYCPIARESPLIEFQMRRGSIVVTFICHRPAG
jgi:hypothetical protein